MRRLALTGLGTAVGLLALAGPASATTFCVPTYTATCPNDGVNVAQPSIQAAMTTDDSDGVADTILVKGMEIVSPTTIFTTGSDPLLIQGAGPDLTTLTTSSNANIFVVDLGGANTRAVTLRDLKIAVPASAPDNGGVALQVKGDTLENVDIVSRNPGSSGSQGISSWIGGGTYTRGEVGTEAGGALDTAIDTGNSATGAVTIEGVTIRNAHNALSSSSPNATVTARRVSLVDPIQTAFDVTAGTLTVENSTISEATDATPLAAEVKPNSANSPTLIADHVTAVHTGATNVAAIASNVYPNASGSSSAVVSDSIFRGFGDGYQRQTFGGSTGKANLTARYSNLPLSGSSTGAGTLTVGEGNITADPLFTGPTDFSLQPGSPSIDAGDPAPGGLSSDFLGAPRPNDGNQDGVAIRDQGAYEYQAEPPTQTQIAPTQPTLDVTPPQTAIGKGPGKARMLTHGKAKFSFSSSEPGSTFECKLDRKSFAACSAPVVLKHLKRGRHEFSVRAIDAAGNADPSPANAKFKVKHRRHRRH